MDNKNDDLIGMKNDDGFKDDFEVNITDEMYDNFSGAKIPVNKENAYLDNPEVLELEEDDYYSDDEQEKLNKKEHKKRNKIKAVKNKRVFKLVWIFMVAFVGLSLGSYLITGTNDLFAVGRRDSTVQIQIPNNINAHELSVLLEDSGVINSAEFFELYCAVTVDMEYVQNGVFEIPTNMDYEGIANFLQASQAREVVNVLFQEGMRAPDIAALLEENEVCDAEDFLEAINDTEYDKYDMIEMIDNDSDKYYLLEGYLFPATYEFYLHEDIDSVVGKFLYNFQLRYTAEMLEQTNNSGYTLDEIIIMASIIQSEAANVEDMARVSAVLHNRLENGAEQNIFTIGMDSTYFYPYRSAADAPDGYVSNYETETNAGLPAGAVSNPGTDAIKAALNPDPNYSNMFYFCHSAEGEAYYAETLAEHEANLVLAGLV